MRTNTGRFLNDLRLSVIPGSLQPFVLQSPLAYLTTAGLLIVVPKGFNTDLASIPPGLRWRRFIGSTARPGALHDYLYSPEGAEAIYKVSEAKNEREARKWADKIFFEALRSEGLSKMVCLIMWVAVRAFGKRRWSHARREKPDGSV